jgi:hypothetical protein
MRGIPEKYVKEITTLVWGFIWGEGINQIDRKVCCLGVENIEELQNILVFRMESMSLLQN